MNPEKLIAALEEELKQYKQAHKKTDPLNARQVVDWHIQENMITWLEVHIDMMKHGGYE
jgi:septation ring formation regulator EzrA